MTVKEAEIVFKKLCRHYKIRPSLEWTSGRNHPRAIDTWKIILNVDWNNFGVLCHELAHTFHIRYKRKKNENLHGKKHWNIMKRMINYCRKKNWFADELQRRTAPKPERPKPTKDELRKAKIELLEKRKQAYKRKIKLAENRIKKYNRQISALKRFIH